MPLLIPEDINIHAESLIMGAEQDFMADMGLSWLIPVSVFTAERVDGDLDVEKN